MPDDEEGRHYNLRIRAGDNNSISESATVQEGFLVFDYPVLVPGAYSMKLRGGDLTDAYYLPGTRDPADADLMEVGLNNAATFEIDFGDSYVSISGNISGSWQLAGESRSPAVEVVSSDSRVFGHGNVDSAGDFTCGFLLPRTVLLRSNYRDLVQWIGGDSFETARVFDLQPGDRITGVSVIESGIRILLDGPGDLVYHRPSVIIRDDSGWEFHPYTYSDNPFSICNLKPGRYYVQVEGYCDDEVWARQWYGGAESQAGATPIDLAEGELHQIVMELVQGGRIEGNLVREDGSQPYAIEFSLFDAGGEPLCSGYSPWRYFDKGEFKFQGLVNGDHFLGVRTAGDKIWWYPGTWEFTAASPLSIVNHEAIIDVDWVLP